MTGVAQEISTGLIEAKVTRVKQKNKVESMAKVKLEKKVESMARRTVRGKVEKMVEAVAMLVARRTVGVVLQKTL